MVDAQWPVRGHAGTAQQLFPSLAPQQRLSQLAPSSRNETTSQSNVPWIQLNVEPPNDPMEVRARLDALSTSSSKEKKDLELVKIWLDDLNQAFPGHTTDAAPYLHFYTSLEEYIVTIQSRLGRRKGIWKRQGTGKLKKIKNEYLLLRPKLKSQSQVTASRVITMVDHTAKALEVVAEAVPGTGPAKGVAVALSRIAELAKIAIGNNAEASRLSKHADDIKQQLLDKLGDNTKVDEEAARDLCVFEAALNDILCDLERFQKANGGRLQAFVFAKDQKDELQGLQQRLDDTFKAFLTANTIAIRLGLAGFASGICSQQSAVVSHVPDEKVSVDYSMEGQEPWKRCMGALSSVFLHQFRSTFAGRFFFF